MGLATFSLVFIVPPSCGTSGREKSRGARNRPLISTRHTGLRGGHAKQVPNRAPTQASARQRRPWDDIQQLDVMDTAPVISRYLPSHRHGAAEVVRAPRLWAAHRDVEPADASRGQRGETAAARERTSGAAAARWAAEASAAAAAAAAAPPSTRRRQPRRAERADDQRLLPRRQ
eukprot:1131550-Prymnesium_polylepis.1